RQVLAAGEGPAHPLTRGLLTAERRAGAAAYGTGSPEGPGAEREHSGEGVAATGVAVRGRDGGHLLRGPVTLSFPPGSTTALTGPSGSGKTTFGRVLAGLTPATTGEVTYGGARLPSRIQRRTAAQRRAVQYVHQSSSESFEARAPLLGQLAAAGRLLRGMTPEAAEEEALRAARLLGLEDAQLARTPGRLSGGQLQRCALVRAVLARPALLVCDEVTSALDVVSCERLLAALPELLEPARTALLFVSHDLDAAHAAAERAVVFEAGRCVRQGTAADVLRRAPEPQAAVARPEMDPARESG
ncbi:ATP-binding cassette domain-containing protein, partial [Streptomyces nanshensis]